MKIDEELLLYYLNMIDEGTYCFYDVENNDFVPVMASSEQYIALIKKEYPHLIMLPSFEELNIKEISKNFVETLANEKIKDLLFYVIDSEEEDFGDLCFELSLDDAWNDYKNIKLREIGAKWCLVNNLEGE